MRRIRRLPAADYRLPATFGSVSQRERRSSDLFFADLMGRGTPRSSVYRPDAEQFFEALVGRSESSPFSAGEAAEDDPPPKVTPGVDSDEIVVTRADGTRFRVRRRVRAKILTRPGRPRLGFCSDDERVFFRLMWCEGTQGTIDAGANVQSAFKDLLDKVMNQIGRGASPDDIKKTFEDAKVQTFLKVDITKVRDWKITGDLKLEMNKSGIASTSASVSADRGWFKVGIEFKSGPEGQQVTGQLEIPLEKRTIKGKTCPVREVVVWWEAECLKEVPGTITLNPLPGMPKFRERTERLFLYFDYAKDTLRRDSKVLAKGPIDELKEILASEPKIGTARLNKRQLEQLDYLVGQGYWVTSVNGYASPEGRRAGPGPRERGPAAKWEGNDALSRERAEKVSKLIDERYRTTMMLRPLLGQRTPVMGKPTAAGLSEHPRLDTRLGGELEGRALDSAILRGDPKLGVIPFLEKHPDELTRMTDEDQKFVNDKSKSDRQRAERLFENLRRVEINLVRQDPVPPTTISVTNFEHVHNCPKDLVEAAERKWGSRIPFFKKDPPICP